MFGRTITGMLGLVASVLLVGGANAVDANIHYRYHLSNAAPGEVGASQLERGGPIPGYYQPVEIRAPQGVNISLVVDRRFQPETASPVVAGMLIGQVYRFRVTNIPLNEGRGSFSRRSKSSIACIRRLGKKPVFRFPWN